MKHFLNCLLIILVFLLNTNLGLSQEPTILDNSRDVEIEHQAKGKNPYDLQKFFEMDNPLEAAKALREHAQKYHISIDAYPLSQQTGQPHRASGDQGGTLIHLFNETEFIPEAGLGKGLDNIALQTSLQKASDEKIVCIVQTKGQMSIGDVIEFLEAGVKIYDPVGPKSIIARFPISSLQALRSKSYIHWMGLYKSEYKYSQSPSISRMPGAFVHPLGGDKPEYRRDLENIGIKIRGYDPVANFYDVILDVPQFQDVAKLWWVKGLLKEPEVTLLNSQANSVDVTVNYEPNDSRELIMAYKTSYTGNGVTVGVMDSPIFETHPELNGIFHSASTLTDGALHGTHVVGIIAGREKTITGAWGSSTIKGVVNSATILYRLSQYIDWDWLPIWFQAYADDFAAFRNNNVQISNHSYTFGTNQNPRYEYNSYTHHYDAYCDNDDMLLVIAAGNFPATRVTNPATGKNVVSVGAIHYVSRGGDVIGELAGYSCPGPTDEDSRLKPELVAPGGDRGTDEGVVSTNSDPWDDGSHSGNIDGNYEFPEWQSDDNYIRLSGTSMAAPHVTGVLAKMKQWKPDIHSELAKALLINTTIPIKANSSIASEGYANTRVGYGMVNGFSITSIYSGESERVLFAQGTVTQDDLIHETTFTVPSGTKKLAVTMAYNDQEGEASATNALNDDLDLTLIAPDGSQYQHQLASGVLTESPLEKIVIEDPPSGSWKAKIEFTSSPGFNNWFVYAQQRYGLVGYAILKEPELSVTVPQTTINVNAGQDFTLQPTIKNVGGYIAAGVTVKVTEHQSSGNFEGDIDKSRYVGNLLYQNASVSPQISLKAPGTPGPYALKIEVDGINKEFDNSPPKTQYVTLNVQSGGSVGPVVYNAHTIDDDTSGGSYGNGDGEADAGETIELIVDLKNQGSNTVNSVYATLSTNDSYITSITDNYEYFYDIPGNSTQKCQFDFDFTVSSSCPAGHVVTFQLDITSSNGGPWSDTFTVKVGSGGSGGNVGPVVYNTHTIDDDSSGGSNGNSDGEADAGETVELLVRLKNNGIQTAQSVYATLSTTDSYITITDNSEYFSNISGGGTALCTADYDFRVSSGCPAGHVVTFKLDITSSNGGPWSDTFTVKIGGGGSGGNVGPVVYNTHTIDDDTSGGSNGNGDGEADAGETVELLVRLKNNGTQTTQSVYATLSTTDSYITITDNSEYFSNISGGGTALCTADYDFRVSSGCPAGHVVTFKLDITSSNGGPWSDTFTVTIGGGGSGGNVGPVVYNAQTIDDDTSGGSNGNGDGEADAGETIELIVDLKNLGSQTANSVYATLSTNDSYITSITDNYEYFYDIPGSGTQKCQFDFDFVVSSSCPAGHVVTFKLDITSSNGGPWSDTFTVTIGGGGSGGNVGPLAYNTHTIDDDTSGGSNGNGDGVADAGETIELIVDLKNLGSQTANSVYATLSTNDGYITSISDNYEYFYNIPGSGTQKCEYDFDFVVSSSCPAGHVVTFRLDITSSNGGPWSDTFTVTIGGGGSGGSVGPVVYNTHTIDDDTSGGSNGNGDGEADAGETVELLVRLKNNGTQTAQSVYATLSTSDSYITLTDDYENFYDISSGGTAQCSADFDFQVSSGCPAGHVVTFRLDIYASNGGPWSDTFTVTIGGGGSGSNNLALNRPTTVSSTYNSNYPGSNAVDGNSYSYWRSENGTASDHFEWIYVELDSYYNVSQVVVDWRGSYYATRYSIQTWDGSQWVFQASGLDGSSGIQTTQISPPVYTKWVAVGCNTANSSTYSYAIDEFEIYSSSARSSEVPGGLDNPPSPPKRSLYNLYITGEREDRRQELQIRKEEMETITNSKGTFQRRIIPDELVNESLPPKIKKGTSKEK